MTYGSIAADVVYLIENFGLSVAHNCDNGKVVFVLGGKTLAGSKEHRGGEVGVYISDDYSHLSLAARGNFHYEFVDNLDTYVGLNLGVLGRSFALNGHLGARYYFGKFGVNVEFGMGNHAAGGTLGVSKKF